MSDGIDVSRDGAVMAAAFARPEKKNAITSAMYEALIEALDEAERDAGVCALVVSGKGGVFTAGNDIGDFLAAAAAGSRDASGSPGWRFVMRLAEFEKPLIAAVEGAAIGIGTTLCFHCDLVYAAPSARFQMPFVNLGLVPEAGSSLLAPHASDGSGRRNYFCSLSPSTLRGRSRLASSTKSCPLRTSWPTRWLRRNSWPPSPARRFWPRAASCAATRRR